MKKFLQEFKSFALRGNVMDMSIGIIIGAAFQAIVKSLTEDILSPLIGLFGKTNFNDMSATLLGVELRYGAFITAIINFVIMAFVIFLLVKTMNKLAGLGKAPTPAAAPTTKNCPYCLSEIPLAATKCAHCTSALESTTQEEATV